MKRLFLIAILAAFLPLCANADTGAPLPLVSAPAIAPASPTVPPAGIPTAVFVAAPDSLAPVAGDTWPMVAVKILLGLLTAVVTAMIPVLVKRWAQHAQVEMDDREFARVMDVADLAWRKVEEEALAQTKRGLEKMPADLKQNTALSFGLRMLQQSNLPAKWGEVLADMIKARLNEGRG